MLASKGFQRLLHICRVRCRMTQLLQNPCPVRVVALAGIRKKIKNILPLSKSIYICWTNKIQNNSL
jgi:hypothetical protein